MSRFEDLILAKRWVNDPVLHFFGVEIRNERQGGVSPATVSSAIDSVSQAPDDVLNDFFDGDPVNGMQALLMIRDIVPGDTLLDELVSSR